METRHWISETEQRLQAGSWRRHRHRQAYAAIIVSGGYLEQGDSGRWQVEAGDILTHRAFEAHANQIFRADTVVLNLALPIEHRLPPVFRVADPDLLVAAVRSRDTAAATLLQPSEIRPALTRDWPDLLAAALRRGPVAIGAWARGMGLPAATVSRGFHAAFATGAARYRVEAQAHAALHRILADTAPLVEIAHQCGFADQAHMTRAVLALTGRTPGAWRKINSIQEDASPSR